MNPSPPRPPVPPEFADTQPARPLPPYADADAGAPAPRRTRLARAVDALPWAFCAVAVAWATQQVVTHRLRPAGPPVAVTAVAPSVPAGPVAAPPSPAPPALSAFEALVQLATQPVPAPSAVRTLLAEVLATGDHEGRPFVVVDKRGARVWVFDAQGAAVGTSAVLVGFARGDDSPPGIGDKPLDAIGPHERITPAGRFLAAHGVNTNGEDVIWVDYDAAVSMHRLRPTDPAQRRPQRLASPTPADNRITWGCINVPPSFYERTLLPLVRDTRPVVYVLPETRPLTTLIADLHTAAAARHARADTGADAPPAHPTLAPKRDG